ncbi:alcohol dehydrogenase 4 [Kluyveromyces marxianus]|uniref:Alcohol dehydrogenase 4 n=1 Tax=Kluyveromyces marxianus TaxID=4911 RepID=A0ABX6ER44_KLUMA|nr:alcohol dehydrogenase 4 [Kluyveromyces marxianus]
MFHRRALKTAERIKLNPLFYSKQRLIKDNQSILKKEMSSTVGFYMPPVSYFGEGALDEVAEYIKNQDYKRPVIITDPGISKIGLAQRVTKLLEKRDRVVGIYDQTQPNPTTSNVNAGLMVLKEHKGDIIISIGGGSAHDNAKAIALLATNGGEIGDYEGVNKSKKKALPMVAINTTAGTASEMTKFTIITNEEEKVKMAIIDNHITPSIAVNDPSTMYGLPPPLTAATGLDALTHCIESYVSTAANPITDTCALKGVELIHEHLFNAFKNGQDSTARTGMCYAQYLAGMAFNNASLGYVHAIAHQLGGFYHLPHGVCNAVLLPHVQSFNKKDPRANERLGQIAPYLGAKEANADSLVERLLEFTNSLEIPRNLKELGVKEEDFEILAEHALKDVCGLTNPIQFTKVEVVEIIRQAYEC